MQLRQLARKRQADPEHSLGPVERALALREQLEHVRQRSRVDAHAVVAHAHASEMRGACVNRIVFERDLEPNPAPALGELRGLWSKSPPANWTHTLPRNSWLPTLSPEL